MVPFGYDVDYCNENECFWDNGAVKGYFGSIAESELIQIIPYNVDDPVDQGFVESLGEPLLTIPAQSGSQ